MTNNPFDFTETDDAADFYGRTAYHRPASPATMGWTILLFQFTSVIVYLFAWFTNLRHPEVWVLAVEVLAIVLYIACNVLSLLWVATDNSGEPNGPLWLLILLILGPLGMLIYLTQRPH
jgi:hypothetical protein